MPETRLVGTSLSGRYLVREPAGKGPFRLLAGFHGYGQLAEDELVLLEALAESQDWLCCSIEALHPFYNRRGTIGASWMARRDRARMIGENVRYIDAVMAAISSRYPLDGTVVYHGFSHGATMAARAAILGKKDATAVMLLCGKLPPEQMNLGPLRLVHFARGNSDRLYKLKEFEEDRKKLKASGVPCIGFSFRGGHASTKAYVEAASAFLKRL
ncbi:phospholipase [Prosthecochloris sp. GSB1]|uniref:alpha/beta hydrolase n=1 Tax=Prosthecochloris sp. GSB1 TaxID=281093 RepID=UPI000B8D06D4|nr:phospholipase [Prosthecochloris sp. GSB1]ASQ90568.1 phospholipase [Prosthecochloris sp. GSB1]